MCVKAEKKCEALFDLMWDTPLHLMTRILLWFWKVAIYYAEEISYAEMVYLGL